MAADATTRTIVLQGDAGTTFTGPVWSPDGTRIAVEKANPGVGDPEYVGNPQLVVVNTSGTNATDLGAATGAAWSADSQTVYTVTVANNAQSGQLQDIVGIDPSTQATRTVVQVQSPTGPVCPTPQQPAYEILQPSLQPLATSQDGTSLYFTVGALCEPVNR